MADCCCSCPSSRFRLRWPVVFLGYLIAGLLGSGPALGQTAPDSLGEIGRRLVRYRRHLPTEKLYVHLDRPSYVSGETMWLKLYVADGTTHRPSANSTVAYVEVLDLQQQPVVQASVALRNATGQGSLLLPAELASGRYTVRAYTSWMQNFPPEYYFHTTVTILNTRTSPGPLTGSPASTSYDPQFFPEGGYLVQGLPGTVGFKLTDHAGRSLDAQGTVLDPAGAVVARFSTLHFGLGSFSFTPAKAGAAYKAVIRLANQQTLTCSLPAVREQGYGLHLEEAGAEQLRVVVRARGEALMAEPLYLLGHARQQIALATPVQLQAGQAVVLVPKQQLAAGVSHFTLFNSRRQPVCERLYFRRPTEALALRARPDKPQYAAREKVTLSLTAAGEAPANLSVAVYQLDSLSAPGAPDIASYLWLSADVSGLIEHPEYYLTATGSDVAAATDNLLLTQGWSRFSWADVLADQLPAPAYPPELHGHLVRGRVLNGRTGAPVSSQLVYLTAPGRFPWLYAARSQADGRLLFEVPNWYGPKQLIAQPDPRDDSLSRVEILSPFSSRYAADRAAPFTLSTEALASSLLRRHVQAEVRQHYVTYDSAHYQVPAADSLAFYGQPNERYLLDRYTRFRTLEDVMREYVPGVLVRARKDGFHLLIAAKGAHTTLENPLILLDGMPVFDTNQMMAFDPLKIRQLDVVTSRYVVGSALHDGIVSYTTYSGDLAGFSPTPQALLQSYQGQQGQREFYAPRYDTPAAAQSRLPDFRNLLHWAPDVVTTAGRETTLTFYTSDQLGAYRVVVQGLSQDGRAGSLHFNLEVKGVQ